MKPAWTRGGIAAAAWMLLGSLAAAAPAIALADSSGATLVPTPSLDARVSPKTAADAIAPPEMPIVPVAPNEGLLGDIGGARTAWANRGFTINGHLTSEFAGNATGGIPIGGTSVDRGTALSTEVGLGFDADLGKLTGTRAGIVHALFTTRFGSSLSTTALGNLISVQEVYGDGQSTRVTYLDYEQFLLEKKLSVELGKINQQNDFIAGSSYWDGNLYCFFQNNILCGTPAGIPTNNGVTAAGSAGYNYYP